MRKNKVTITCDKCGRKKNGEYYWARVTFDSAHYAYDEGTIDEEGSYDLCTECKRLFTGFLNNQEYEKIYAEVFVGINGRKKKVEQPSFEL
jgi:hypothetical protein